MYDFVKKIHDGFKGCYFYEKTHQYFYGNQILGSSTGFIKKYSKPFNRNYILPYSTLKKLGHKPKFDKSHDVITVNGISYTPYEAINYFNLTTPMQDLESIWNRKGDLSRYKGTELHFFIECFYARKIYNPEKTHAGYSGYTFSEIKDDYNKNRTQFLQFHNATKDYLIPIMSEVIICEKEHLIGGMIDQIFYDTRIDKYVIYDWKTNSDFTTTNRYEKMAFPFHDLDDCKLSKYSLQLNLYRYIFEKYTGIEMGIPQIVLFDIAADTYQIFQTFDLHREFKEDVFSDDIFDLAGLPF